MGCNWGRHRAVVVCDENDAFKKQLCSQLDAVFENVLRCSSGSYQKLTRARWRSHFFFPEAGKGSVFRVDIVMAPSRTCHPEWMPPDSFERRRDGSSWHLWHVFEWPKNTPEVDTWHKCSLGPLVGSARYSGALQWPSGPRAWLGPAANFSSLGQRVLLVGPFIHPWKSRCATCIDLAVLRGPDLWSLGRNWFLLWLLNYQRGQRVFLR